ncbi:MAG: hypothetical protein R6U32_01580 [Candidatus Woesearchaeota archaeon]
MKSVRPRKAQAGKVFMYALTLIVVAMILLFGYKAIAKVTETSEAATMAQFKNNLRNKIDTASSHGRITTEEFETPMKFKAICFVAEDNPDDLNREFVQDYPWGADVADSPDNAFLFDGQNIDPFKVDNFEIDDGDEFAYGPDALCVPINNGQFSLRLEGLGDRTLINS